MKRLAHDCRKISCLTNEVVVLHARPGDTDSVNFLKRIGADQVLRHLAGDHYKRRRIHVSVRNAGHGIRGPWTRSHEHRSDSTCCACITLGHVYCALLVTHEVVRNAIPCAPQFVVDVKHRAPRIAEDRVYSLMDQRLDEHLCAGWHRRQWFGRCRLYVLIENMLLSNHYRIWDSNAPAKGL